MDEKFSKLNDIQLEAVECTEGPLLILAGAGSGKTRVLTHRIAYLIEECGVSPYSILALTFTNKAAAEMKERVNKLVGVGAENIWVSTFHSSCVRILRRFIDLIGYDRNFTIYDSDDQKSLMREVCKYFDIDTKKFKEKTILSVISSAKDELVDPDRFEQQSPGDPASKIFARCYREYQKRLHANNALDFDDLIMKTIELFKSDSSTLDYYRRRFRYIMVDEYQDTNSAQFELIRLLAEYKGEDGSIVHNLCVVGDDDQSIYKFRGANIRNILDFEHNYPEARVIRLEQNYRSTKSILDVANDVIRNNLERKSKRLWTENVAGDTVRLINCDSDTDEAGTVTSEISAAVREGSASYSDFAILYRTNAQSRAFEEKLIFRNIPYRIIGGQNFYQRKEIKDILAYLRTIASGRDSVAIKRIINVPKRGIGLATLDKIDMYCEEHDTGFYDALVKASVIPGVARAAEKIERFVALIEVMRSKVSTGCPLKNIIDELLEATGYIDYLSEEDDDVKVEERVENINELISKITSYEEDMLDEGEHPTLEGFLDEVSLVADIDSYAEDSDYVVLMTIHSAKGLEFPHVYLCGMEDGIFPGYMSINADNPAEEIEEERRLCYVGITRAEDTLTLTAAKKRMMRGELTFNPLSRFVKEIPRHLLKVENSESYGSSFFDDSSSRRKMSEGDRNGRFTPALDTPAKSFSGGKAEIGKLFSSMGIYKGAAGSKSQGVTVDYTVGDSVRHIKFGVGKVTALERDGDDYLVSVEFPSGLKRMKASFAKLIKQ